MKVRELVYWVVILLQLILLVGVKEHTPDCSICQKPAYMDEMTFHAAYGLIHKDCEREIPPPYYDDSFELLENMGLAQYFR